MNPRFGLGGAGPGEAHGAAASKCPEAEAGLVLGYLGVRGFNMLIGGVTEDLGIDGIWAI